MAGTDNLLKAEDMTSEQLRERARKGGIASAKARKEKRMMKETIELLLAMPLEDKSVAELEDILTFSDLRNKNVTVNDAIIIKQVQKAMKGDLNALAFLRDTSGQKPKDDIAVDMKLPVFFEGEDDLED